MTHAQQMLYEASASIAPAFITAAGLLQVRCSYAGKECVLRCSDVSVYVYVCWARCVCVLRLSVCLCVGHDVYVC